MLMDWLLSVIPTIFSNLCCVHSSVVVAVASRFEPKHSFCLVNFPAFYFIVYFSVIMFCSTCILVVVFITMTVIALW